MKDRTLIGVGVTGAALAALCCFTPVLVALAGIVGLSAITGYLDYVLLPALVFFVGLTIFAVVRQRPKTK
ncbi:mercury resistance system transport protein MerF [Sphingobium sp. TKS]|uniref:mercury resistance system transport protein MerF n=1 Tax=Sphingobium sp. TKS TaxID=1315974 RepID=UPI00076FFA76|nr:mercury resistance system transport protein MerF [Sphingobium sp. TKS]AMK21652.1 MerF mercury ion transport protein [Sphingobium sp. TKS]